MFDTATYRPNRLVTDGSAWMRAQGIPNHKFSHQVVGDHVHMLNCMFDMVTLFAVVETHSSGYGKVTKTGRCHVCNPPKPEPAPKPVSMPSPVRPVTLPSEVRNLTQRDREFNIDLVAVAMRAATDREMWDLWQGYKRVLGWTETSRLWQFAAWRREKVSVNTTTCAQVAPVLRAFRATLTQGAEVAR